MVFCAGKFNRVFEVFLRPTLVAKVTKIWNSTSKNEICARSTECSNYRTTNHCLDEPHWEADDDNLVKKTTGPSRTLSRRAGRFSRKKQEHNLSNTGIETDSRDREKKRSSNLQLLCGLTKSLRLQSIGLSHKATWAIGLLQSYGVGIQLIELLKTTDVND